jgi:hypothetical protein
VTTRLRRRRWTHFEKVRILFAPKFVTVRPDAASPGRYELRYGPRPEHLVRSYASLELARASGEKLARKFGATLIVHSVEEKGSAA